jgi:hypothetical protein
VTVTTVTMDFPGMDLECFDWIYLNKWTAMLARYR